MRLGREEREKEEALLQAVEEEERWEAERKQQEEEEERQEVERKRREEEEKQQRVEAALAVEKELREQGWRLDESLEEFWWHQQREEKWREVDVEDWGPCLDCWSRKIDCVQE